jgi:hypothetical protein
MPSCISNERLAATVNAVLGAALLFGIARMILPDLEYLAAVQALGLLEHTIGKARKEQALRNTSRKLS